MRPKSCRAALSALWALSWAASLAHSLATPPANSPARMIEKRGLMAKTAPTQSSSGDGYPAYLTHTTMQQAQDDMKAKFRDVTFEFAELTIPSPAHPPAEAVERPDLRRVFKVSCWDFNSDNVFLPWSLVRGGQDATLVIVAEIEERGKRRWKIHTGFLPDESSGWGDGWVGAFEVLRYTSDASYAEQLIRSVSVQPTEGEGEFDITSAWVDEASEKLMQDRSAKWVKVPSFR